MSERKSKSVKRKGSLSSDFTGRERILRKLGTIKIDVLHWIEYCQIQKNHKSCIYSPLHCGSMSSGVCLKLEWRLHTGSHSPWIGFLTQFLCWPEVYWSEPPHLPIPMAYLEQRKYPNKCFLNLLYNNPWNVFSTENLIN